jgi:tRNA A37 threonylcarbamoyladenosine dehydratase/predicted adenine nucleotide alpha hydrolase (AANH) superfamily ATPase
MKLLLHCCCAPCSVSCVKALRADGIEPELFWYNPNIHPYTEYSLRRDCLTEFAANENLKLTIHDEYGLRIFLDTVNQCGRCRKCYNLRLEKAASFAAQNGYSAFCTTLLVSPYQDHEGIKRAGEEAAKMYGIDFLYRDFRPLFREGQEQARAKGLYMQKYCGCIFSEEERYLKNKPPPSLNSVNAKESIFDRLSLITGEENLEKLKSTKVLVFGAGGVGSWCAEALVRCGIGKIGIIDYDTICASNVNRQVEATAVTIGQPKAQTLKNRLLEINPECEITSYDKIFSRETADAFDIGSAGYVIDAIDSLNNKIDLIETACAANVTLYSSMGMALKIDPSRIKTGSIWNTQGCPLARLVRQGLRKRGFSSDFTVVYSGERLQRAGEPPLPGVKPVNGSVVTVTASAGLLLASLVLRDITGL